MNTIITREDIRAYSEVDYIIHHMNKRYIDMVPKKLLKFFSDMKDPDYVVKVDPYVPLQKQSLSNYALELIALMHLKYWCEDEARKKELYDIMLSNESTLLEKMYEKQNVDTIFENFENEGGFINNSEEYSRPREIQTFEAKKQEAELLETANNENEVVESADTTEEENSSKESFNQENIQEEKNEENYSNLPTDEESKSKGFFTKLKEKIISFFSKNKQNA